MQTTRAVKSIIQSHFTWRIEDLAAIIELGLMPGKVRSEVQNIPGLKELTYSLEVDLNAKDGDNKAVLWKLFLNASKMTPDMPYHFKSVKIVLGDINLYNQKSMNSFASTLDEITGLHILSDDILKSDVLTLDVSITITSYEVIHSDLPKQTSESTISCIIADDFGKLLNEETFADVTLKASNGKEFAVHKCILSARSPVFAAMFSHENVMENQNNCVIIEDISSETLHELLRFIYIGKIERIKDPIDLLAASEKYLVKELREICEIDIYKNLNTSNALKVLEAAQLFNYNEGLKKKAFNIIESDYKKLLINIPENMIDNASFIRDMMLNQRMQFLKFKTFKTMEESDNGDLFDDDEDL